MKYTVYFSLLFLMNLQILDAQQAVKLQERYVSGRIIDAENGEPITGASVFIAGTTVGASTDANGNYQLKIPGEGSYRLVVSHVAYQSVFEDIEPGNVSVVFNASMNTSEIEEVTVSARVRFRSRDINLFWRTILGKPPSKRGIHVVNPEDVYYFYNSETRILKVTCRVPLHIINNETGYHLQLMLDHFTYNYNTNTSSWSYQPMFSELEPENKKQKMIWESNRIKIHRVSLDNFIKSLYDNRLSENGFLLVQSTNLHHLDENPKTFLSIDSVAGTKMLHIPTDLEDLMLVCFGKPIDRNTLLLIEQAQKGEIGWDYVGLFRHYIKTPNGPVQIFPDGTNRNFLQIDKCFSSNWLGGLDMTLPTDYFPDVDYETMSSVYETDVAVENWLVAGFKQQLRQFPQEKIYLHTDKPYYISGERIWFRAHLANATSHFPEPVSRYVYVELINPLDSIVTRVKIRQEEGAYHGYLHIPDDVPEGDYTMRAYTTFMQSQDEHYFCTKTIRVGDPQVRVIHTETKFTFETNRRIQATFRFTSPSQSSQMGGDGGGLVPKSVKVSVNDGKMMNLKMDSDGTTGFNFNLPANSRKRTLLLEVVAFNNPYRQFIQIPTPDDDFDVTFYPEGGSLMQGALCKTVFKAMKSNGQATDISGAVYDQTGTEIAEIHSDHLGMGSFLLNAEKDKSYYVICENDKGQTKRFELPAAVNQGYALSVVQVMDKIHVTAQRPAEATQNDELYLLAHTRGMVHFVSFWNHEKPLALRQDIFPSGVLHLILFDANRNPVSERLVFINNQDQAQVSYFPDKKIFEPRSLVNNRVILTDSEGKPLTGNFSVSVTSDREVTPDSTSNILTQLLLASDLRGNIENPAYYFQNSYAATLALDLLMCTQGWRRYHIAEIAQGRFSRPTFPIEIGAEISGTVKTVLSGKPEKNVKVNITSLKSNYIENTKTDKDGCFHFYDCEFPDSTWFLVSTEKKSGKKRMDLIMDKKTFPERTLITVLSAEMDRMQFAKYADKAEMQYINEGGERVYEIEEVTITATRKPEKMYPAYAPDLRVNYSATAKEIEEFPVQSISALVHRIAPLFFGGAVITFGGDAAPLFLLDDVPMNPDLILDINPNDVAQIDIIKKESTETTVFGMQGANGVIIIYTKRGENMQEFPPFHIRSFLPLGYQQPVEFYAPKYDTPEKRNAPTPDLRTTIHWQPVVQTDSAGEASFEFYTADNATSYTVVIEGLANDGSIIRKKVKTW